MTSGTDGRAQAGQAVLARLGLHVGSGAEVLRTLGVWDEEGPTKDCWPVVEAVAAAPNASAALRALALLAERHPSAWRRLAADPRLLARAAIVAGASEALGGMLATDSHALAVLDGDLEPWSADEIRARGAGAITAASGQAAHALVGVQRRGLLRVAARDLLGMIDTPTASRELSALADGILAAALDHVHGQSSTCVAVIGMGKLGGQELNYVSDVDVLFVHDGDLTDATRMARQFLALLGEVTPHGRAYEIDANLRPEGRDGQLSRSIDAYGAYYGRWAKTWEFQALLKARPVAGDAGLGAQFMALTSPYVWPDRLDVKAVAEIQQMKGVVESSRQVRRDSSRQVKLAPGGLRDIEFAVQLLQLVHGRHDPTLRSPNTLEALSALARGGYVGNGDAALFSDAYMFLRTVEHRLQLGRLLRTHTIPSDGGARYRLARAVGFRDITAATALEQFDREYARVQNAVRRLHEKLFYRPLLARFAQLGAEQVVVSGEPARERLVALGFRDAAEALAHIEALAGGVSRPAQLFRTLLPALLETLAAAPDPDGGLAGLRSLAERLGGSPFFLRALRDTPPVGDLLARVLGSSRRVGEWLEHQPEVIGALVDLPGLARALDTSDYRRLADGVVRRGEVQEGAAANALRRLRRREAARTAVRDLGGHATLIDVMVELTGLAEACLEAAVALVVPAGVRLAVIGMGKLGGKELGYASDLDVLIVFEPAQARDDALAATEQLLQLLSAVTPEGQVFRVDANLRPEGRHGPLGRTLDSYLAYYQRWAESWELQALTQARPVAGDRALGEAFVEAVAPLVYPTEVPPERLQAVRVMKARVERERAGAATTRPGHLRPQPTRPARPAGTRADLKLGRGGMSDVEWTVQLLQLAHGGLLPALRRPGTLPGLAACEHASLLSSQDARWLRDGWLLLGRVRNALYLAGHRDTDRLPSGRGDREHLARLLGCTGVQAFTEDLDRAMRRIRKAHKRTFYR
ncbi:MAG: bifunctional [glutamine synthetase] adenylyltransferase/[glutamine synthetase]-adenylyl-L-tyrosine phosphorylase [Egibacteraceae bacterium]